ncbi:hypothetical protein EJ110_NYTH03418 [Nymphaea thermarum]|nr:hypothetical protein EJ110_NYTH03418 [Nymphaea thermarum]
MSQFPSFMRQLPAMPVVPSSLLLPSQWPHSQNDEFTLTLEEAELEDKQSYSNHVTRCKELKNILAREYAHCYF